MAYYLYVHLLPTGKQLTWCRESKRGQGTRLPCSVIRLSTGDVIQYWDCPRCSGDIPRPFLGIQGGFPILGSHVLAEVFGSARCWSSAQRIPSSSSRLGAETSRGFQRTKMVDVTNGLVLLGEYLCV